MGLLSEGKPLSWEETKKLSSYVREHGIKQFINLYKKLMRGKQSSNEEEALPSCLSLKWGDEVEYMIVKFDHEKKTAKLSLRAAELLPILQESERLAPDNQEVLWRPEYAGYMIEGTPGQPYGHNIVNFNRVEANMKYRREQVKQILGNPNETILSLTAFPRMGCPDFTTPHTETTPNDGASRSIFYPDDVIFGGHPRFKTLTRNIRERRNQKVNINIPIYKDDKTPVPLIEDLHNTGEEHGESLRAAKPDHVYLDCMGFGMGCSCLQMTFQACNIEEACHLYDQLTALTPIVMALSAASPIYRGFLTEVDCRWNIISGAVDDRTQEERGMDHLKLTNRIPKSRYDSIDCYLSESNDKYNDIQVQYDNTYYKMMRDNGIDHFIARHIAHLFIRDPISLFAEKLEQNDETDTDHFENIQSTNWQTMRFKPPPPNSGIGWRVEFRPTEVQLTDFENAAFVTFVVLMSRVILSYNLNLLIPISKVDENMQVAQKRDAARKERFYFRKDLSTKSTPPGTCATAKCDPGACMPRQCEEHLNNKIKEEYTQMTIDEIINGKDDEFPGLIPLIERYLESTDDIDVDTSCTITQYLWLIQRRANGELLTTAQWMRDFVHHHPEYEHNSVVSERVNYDLMVECEKITEGAPCKKLLSDYNTKSNDRIPELVKRADSYLEKKSSLHH